VTEENLEGFFVGRYEHAKPEVKQLFLFAYCDCAIEMMGKPVSEELNAKEYFQKFPEAGSSLVRVVLTTEAWEQAGKKNVTRRRSNQENAANAGNVPRVIQGNGEQRGGDENSQATKSKGGRPKDSWSFDTHMLPCYTKFLKEEMRHRRNVTDQTEASSEETQAWASWYKGAIEEILRVTKPAQKPAPAQVAENTTASVPKKKDDEEDEEYIKALEMCLEV